jgi:HEPN domain-containing protein
MAKTRKDFQRLAAMRAREARALVKNGNENGAYYLGGFAVECALKACIAKKTNRYDFPAERNYAAEVYTHDLSKLLKLGGLDGQLDQAMRSDAFLAAKWGVVKSWNVSSRYELSGLNGKDMTEAVVSKNGVLRWIKQYW